MSNNADRNNLFNITDQRKSRLSHKTQDESHEHRNNRKRETSDDASNFFRVIKATELSHEEHKFDNRNRNKSYTDLITDTSNKKSDYVEKKYGIKTLLQAKSKFVYPFNNERTESISDKAIDNIEKYKKCIVDNESDSFIESIKHETNFEIKNRSASINDDIELINDIKNRTDNIIKMDNQVNKIAEDAIEQNNEIMPPDEEPKKQIVKNDDLKGYVPRRLKHIEPEIIADQDENVVDAAEHVDVDVPVIENIPPTSVKNVSDLDPQSQLLVSRRLIESMCIKNTQSEIVHIEFPKLSFDDISVSLKVVGDLPTYDAQTKLIVVNSTHLAIDTSVFQSISRYGSGQGRELIFNFLEHMYSELENNIDILLVDIQSNIKIDENILIIRGIICKLAVFLHKYENMRSVYKSDSSMFAKLGNNRDKFHSLMTIFFRKVVINK